MKNLPHAGDGGNVSAHCRQRRQTLTIAAIAEPVKQLPPMAAANINNCRIAVDGGGNLYVNTYIQGKGIQTSLPPVYVIEHIRASAKSERIAA